jgi:adenylosuccinate lyase/3-carboxy-cis,cis-muconate cycloisomerase
MAGRTHSQQALPITFGLKAAIWLSEMLRHRERLYSLQSRVLVGQLGGAVGTQAALGRHAFAVAQKTMEKLGLGHSSAPWHTARDNMAEVACVFALLSGTLAKICNEIFQLGKTEIAELREPAAPGKAISSSTMPHKRNPVLCERVAALNTHVRSLQTVVLEGMLHENERDPRALWSEWLALPQISIYTGTALGYTLKILEGLEVFPRQMLRNLHLHKEAIASEWLLFQLAKKLGKMKAQEELDRIIKEADLKGTSIKESLLADQTLGALLRSFDLSMLDTPEMYTGQAGNIVDRIIAEAQTSAAETGKQN